MQCAIRCAEAHSESGVLATAINEAVPAKPRIFLGVGPEGRPFPNKCRHCEPAPCQEACMPGAIRSDIHTGLKVVDPARCIHCGMLEISLNIALKDRPAAAAVYNKYKQIFLQTVPGATSKALLVRDEDVQVLHGFDSVEHAKGYVTSALFTKDVVKELKPLLLAAPDVRIYESL